MSTYLSGNSSVNNGNLSQTELSMYGSRRLGIWRTKLDVSVDNDPLPVEMTGVGTGKVSTFNRGEKLFELGNHLGNVLATVGDGKLGVSGDGVSVDVYHANVVSAGDYFPFGMGMPGRSYSLGGYRYGFNGKEKNDEIEGPGNNYDYGMRENDPRIGGRFWSVDPLTKKYPELSPYQFASNTPIWGTDLDGKEVRIYTETEGLGHAFLTVGTGKDVIVYTYGRYAGVAPSSGVTLGRYSPNGPGVLVRLTNEKAADFIRSELVDNKAKAFEIIDADPKKTMAYMDKVFNSSTEVPTVGKYKADPDAHIIDKYKLLSCNCTTRSIEGAEAGGTFEDFKEHVTVAPDIPDASIDIISPSGLQNYLLGKENEKGTKVKQITQVVKKEFKAEDKKPVNNSSSGN